MLRTVFNAVEDLLVVFWGLQEEVVGRRPTRAEYEEGRDHGLVALLERMKRDGVRLTPRTEDVSIRT